jgi:hypothetical protein
VRTMLMGGMILRRMHMVVARWHRAGSRRGSRHVEVAKDERQISIDGCQHEPGGNQPAQEQKPEDQRGPARFLNAVHPFFH